ncbi:MAG: T9SS type A sorting domain-containing protein [Candidatus Kapaibacterium sp.]
MTNRYSYSTSFKAIGIVILFLLAGTITQAQQWVKTNGPYGGSITCFVASGSTIFAGTSSNGLFRSTNNGDTWSQTTVGLTASSVSALAVSGTTIYAGTYDGGVFRSSDNGDHWTHVTVGKRPIVTSILVKDSTIIVASNEPDLKNSNGTYLGVVYRSLDNGNTWKEFDVFNYYYKNITSLAVIGSTFFAGTSGGVLYVSSNNAYKWEYITYFGSRDILFAVNGTNLIASGFSHYIRQSKDTGKVWQGKVIPIDITSLAANSSAVFAGTDTGGVFRSTDSCTTWTQVNTGLPKVYIQTLYISGSTLFAGTKGRGIFRSLDYGTTWKEVNTGVRGLSMSAITSTGTVLFAGTYGNGIFRSMDNGRNWSAVNTDVTSPRTNNNNYILALATSGTSVFASTRNGLLLSTDNGEHWKKPDGNQFRFTSFLVTDSVIFACNSEQSSYYRSIDNGNTWTEIRSLSNLGISVNQLLKVGNTLYAATDNNGLLWSDDFGFSWVQARLKSQNSKEVKSIKLMFASGSTIITKTANGENFRSTDNGETWTELVLSEVKKYEILVFAGSDSTIVVGTDSGGVFRSVDNGVTWAEYNTGLTTLNIRSMAIHENNLFVGTANELWRYGIQDASLPTDLITCYPNPANTTLTVQHIDQSFTPSMPVTYTMYNLLGVQVMQFERTESEFTIPTTSLAIGMYALVARQGDVRSSTVLYVAR